MTPPSLLCPICSKIFPNNSKFKEHVRIHAVEKPYCNLCSKEFICQSRLNVHVLGRHERFCYEAKKNFQCSVCGYKMCTENQLINHSRTHTGERPFKCTVNECGMAFKLELTLKNHIKYKHSDERPLKCKFPDCSFTAKTDVNLIGHMRVHSDYWPFACPKEGCNFRAKERCSINRHVKSVHSEAKAFACSMCDYKTARSDTLKYHMHRHTARREFKCSHPKCAESFKSLYDLKLHFSNQHGERNVQCDQPGCGRKFANANALYKHKWDVHSEKIHACPNCSYRTNKARKLTLHMITHDGNNKLMCLMKGCEYRGKNVRTLEDHMRRHKTLLPCPFSGCGRYAPNEKFLNDHVKFHNPVGRPFQCPLCFRYYPTRWELKGHSVVHTKEKPFRCGHCNFGALSRAHVHGHISSVHAKIKFPFIVLPLGNRECLRCKVTLPAVEFVVHSIGHAVPIVMLQRLETRFS